MLHLQVAQEELGKQSMQLLNDVADRTSSIKETSTASLESLKSVTTSQQKMASAVIGLTDLADDSLRKQRELLAHQMQMADVQDRMLQNFSHMEELLGYIARLQRLIFGELMDVHTALWYGGAAAGCLVATAAPRTAAARLPLLFGLALTLAAERAALACVVATESGMQQSTFPLVAYATAVQCLRHVFLGLACVLLVAAMAFYCDYGAANNVLLQQLLLVNHAIITRLDGKTEVCV
eukprot:TRINITY_DN2503_c2_g1_i3.p2 TRINITY_DN2503_c2_g1~~TRINITY_DN2503_c2_g1_i3.p2  ORF type:complete len:237 (-),score=69.99 TRINITY_DN2503_c2_g1_i3:99-809(-)